MTPTASPKSRVPARLVMTLAAWLVAFLTVTALLELSGDELATLPLPVRALVISGVLVTLMANVVMPLLNSAIARTRPGHERLDPAQARRGRDAWPGGVNGSRRVGPLRCWDDDRGPIDRLRPEGVSRVSVVAFLQREGAGSDDRPDGNRDR
jgi:hypothetical protein